MKKLEDYLALAYTIILQRDEDGDYVARVDELPGCAADGESAHEALEHLEEVKVQWIADCLERGDPVPEPRIEEVLPSGKWVQRVPRTLHRKLVQLAEREKVSLNQFVTSILAEAVGIRQKAAQVSQVASHEIPSYPLLHAWDRPLPPKMMEKEIVLRDGTNFYVVRQGVHGPLVRHGQSRHTWPGIAKIFRERLPNDVKIRKAKYGDKEENNIHKHS